MGSTGHGIFGFQRNLGSSGFGIAGAKSFLGNLPKDSGLEKPSSSVITLKVDGTGKSDIIFQFRLLTNGKLRVSGYDPEKHVSASVLVSAIMPTLGKDSNSKRLQGLMNKSAEIYPTHMKSIAQELARRNRK